MHGDVRDMRYAPSRYFQRFDVRPVGAGKGYAYLDRATKRVDCTWKLGQRQIAGRVEYPAVEGEQLSLRSGVRQVVETRDGFLFRLLHHRRSSRRYRQP